MSPENNPSSQGRGVTEGEMVADGDYSACPWPPHNGRRSHPTGRPEDLPLHDPRSVKGDS